VTETRVIRIEMAAEDLVRTRLTFSPLWEAVLGYLAIAHPERRPLHLPWVAQLGRSAARLDLRPLWALVGPYPVVLDFLTPIPDAPGSDFRQEVERLRATPPEDVQSEVGMFYEAMDEPPPSYARPYVERPRRSLDRLADTLTVYWEQAFAPHWPALRAVLEAELLHRAQTLATQGPDVLLGNLHPAVSWSDGTLEIDRPYDMVLHPGGRGLLVLANAFAWPGVLAGTMQDRRTVVIYPPRGLAALWPASPPDPDEALGILLGRSRAAVLGMLDAPRATTDIASLLSMGANTVSYHLGQLRRVGLIDRHRDGRRVYYRLSELGRALIRLWDPAPGDDAEQPGRLIGLHRHP
jgi:DNA-binding transcriptional ArsR family regulator